MEEIKLLNDNILVQLLPEVVTTKGGLIIPEKYREKTLWGTVIATGPGKFTKTGERIPLSVKEGDMILLAGTFNEIIIKDKKYYVLPENIVHVVKEKTNG